MRPPVRVRRARPDDTLVPAPARVDDEPGVALEDGSHDRPNHANVRPPAGRFRHPSRHDRGGLEAVLHRQPRVRPRARTEACHPPRSLCRPRPHGARPRPRPRGGDRPDAGRAALPDGGLPLRRVPARAAPHEQPPQPRQRRTDAPGARRARLGPRRAGRRGGGARPRQRRPRAARVVLHGLDGVSGRPGPRIRHPLRVRHLRPDDQGRLAGRNHRQVAPERQSVGDPAARGRLRGDVRRAHREVERRRRAVPRALGAARRGEGRRLRHAHPRLPRAHLQHAAPLEGRGGGVVRLRGVQPRRLLPRRGRQGGFGEHHEGALPERRDRAGEDPAAAAAVLLRELFTAGHDPPAPASPPAARAVLRHLGRPAQRHAPGHRRRRVDAPARGRARTAVG